MFENTRFDRGPAFFVLRDAQNCQLFLKIDLTRHQRRKIINRRAILLRRWPVEIESTIKRTLPAMIEVMACGGALR